MGRMCKPRQHRRDSNYCSIPARLTKMPFSLFHTGVKYQITLFNYRGQSLGLEWTVLCETRKCETKVRIHATSACGSSLSLTSSLSYKRGLHDAHSLIVYWIIEMKTNFFPTEFQKRVCFRFFSDIRHIRVGHICYSLERQQRP